MKRVLKIIVSFSFVAALTAATMAPAFADLQSGTVNYVAFGDSVAAGVRGGVGESSSDYGYTDDIAHMLRDAGVLGSFNKDFCVSGATSATLAAKTGVLSDTSSSEYKIVKDADIATLTIGANDLLAPLLAYIHSLSNISSADSSKIRDLLNTIAAEVHDGKTAPAIQANIETILQNIISANPDIKIYLMGYYNPFPTVSLLMGVDLNSALKDFNVYIAKAASDIAAKNPNASLTYVDTMTAMSANTSKYLVMTDIHPTEAGYTVIANEFWKQISLLITDSSVIATPTNPSVLVNGKSIEFEAYNINGNNYFKLRDIAMALNGSGKQFNVGWDSGKQALSLTSSSAYTAVGGELAVSGTTAAVTVKKTPSVVLLDETQINLIIYNIGGYNYIKLRDMASVLDFAVNWDPITNTISIDTAEEYTDAA